jgi:hypothetical protein
VGEDTCRDKPKFYTTIEVTYSLCENSLRGDSRIAGIDLTAIVAARSSALTRQNADRPGENRARSQSDTDQSRTRNLVHSVKSGYLQSEAEALESFERLKLVRSLRTRDQLYQTDPWLDCRVAFSARILSSSRMATSRAFRLSWSPFSASEWVRLRL